MPDPMTAEQANAVYDILVEHCGAVEQERERFTERQTYERCSEYRFQGALGFGGKFRRNGWGDRWCVDAYEGDLTAERRTMIDRANAALNALNPVEK
jgi:hypothetical protein